MATAYAAATTTSMVATAVMRPCLSTRLAFSRRSSLPYLLPRSASSFKLLTDSNRFSSFQIRASSEEDTSSSFEVGELVSDLKEKWDALEDKLTVILYSSGAIVAVWLSSIIIGAINSVPLLPKIMELDDMGIQDGLCTATFSSSQEGRSRIPQRGGLTLKSKLLLKLCSARREN